MHKCHESFYILLFTAAIHVFLLQICSQNISTIINYRNSCCDKLQLLLLNRLVNVYLHNIKRKHDLKLMFQLPLH